MIIDTVRVNYNEIIMQSFLLERENMADEDILPFVTLCTPW